MSRYDYRCKECGHAWEDDYGAEVHGCPVCSTTPALRVYAVNVQRSSLRPFTPHYNTNLGRQINSETELREGMKVASAAATAQTGIEHSYATADVRDRDVFGGGRPPDESALRATYDAHAPDSPVRQAVSDMLGT